MTKEEKQLLLINLCARLPYGVKIHIDFNEIGHIVGDATLDSIKTVTGQVFDFVDFEQDFKNGDCLPISGLCGNKLLHIDEFKPYLRSMSSMTEEEKEQLAIIRSEDFRLVRQWVKNESIKETGTPCPVTCGEIDYCNKKHLDYRGLIPKGLALEAPEGMYKNE